MKHTLTSIFLLFFFYFAHGQQADTTRARMYLDSAHAWIDSAQYQKAIDLGKKALNIYQEEIGEMDTLLIRAYKIIGDGFLEKRMIDSAMFYYQKGLPIIEHFQLQNSLFEADIFHALGICYFFKRNDDMSLRYYEKAIDIKVSTLGEEHLSTAKTYNVIGRIFGRQGVYEKAIQYYEKALDIKLQILGENDASTGNSYNNIGLAHMNQGDYDKSIQYLERALKIKESTVGRNHLSSASTYLNLGSILYKYGAYKRSIAFSQKSLRLYLEKFGENHRHVATIFNCLGAAHRRRGDFDKGVYYFEKALSISLNLYGETNPTAADAYHNIGLINKNQGAYDKAIGYYEKTMDIYLKINGEIHETMAGAYTSIGNVLLDQKNYEKSIRSFKRSRNIYFKLGMEMHPSMAAVYDGMSFATGSQEDYDKALNYSKKALNIKLHTLGEKHFSLAFPYTNIGIALKRKDEYQKALHFYRKAMEVLQYDPDRPDSFSQVPDLYLLLSVLKGRIDVYHDMDNAQSNVFIDTIRQLYDQVFLLEDYIHQEFSGQATHFEHYKISYPLYKEAIQTYMNDSTSAQARAFEIAEKSKSRQIADHFRQTNAEYYAGIPDSLLEKEYDLNVGIAYHEKKEYAARYESKIVNDSLINIYKNKLFNLKRDRDALIELFKIKYPAYHRLKYEHEVSTVVQIQNSLQEDEGLVEYFVGDSSIFVFVITSDQFEIREIKNNFPLKEWVVQMRKNIYGHWLNSKHSGERYIQCKSMYAEYAHKLYDKLLEPIASILPEKLIVIPDGVLYFVPFDALLTEPVSAETDFRQFPYVLKKHQISYNYSATLYEYLKGKKQRNSDRMFQSKSTQPFLAFAPSFPGLENTESSVEIRRGDLGPLRHNVAEVEAIQSLLGGDVLRGQQATKENFLKLAGNSRILHLSTHGKSNDKMGDYSFIAFTETSDSILDNDRLYVRELYNMQLQAEMVVLSACESGLGELQRGEGMISLSSGFTYAGARSTVTSLWSVNDAETTHLMTDFYQYLKNGMDKDEALRAAKLSFLEKAQHPDPHFWAAFVPFGNMEPIKIKSPYLRWVFIFGGILLLFLGTLFWRKAKT